VNSKTYLQQNSLNDLQSKNKPQLRRTKKCKNADLQSGSFLQIPSRSEGLSARKRPFALPYFEQNLHFVQKRVAHKTGLPQGVGPATHFCASSPGAIRRAARGKSGAWARAASDFPRLGSAAASNKIVPFVQFRRSGLAVAGRRRLAPQTSFLWSAPQGGLPPWRAISGVSTPSFKVQGVDTLSIERHGASCQPKLYAYRPRRAALARAAARCLEASSASAMA